jgi:thiol-disulfide isomerase/thioredoxin
MSIFSGATCAMPWQTDVLFLFNASQSNMMSDTGFTCPKCDHSFPTAEQVAEHLRNEHTDGTQTESTK